MTPDDVQKMMMPNHHVGNIVPGHDVHGISGMPHAAPEVPTAVPAAPEMPHISVDAQSGHGYEFMAKRLSEQLHAQHLDPNKFAADSDIHKLLTADAKTINGVVHTIAKDHGFFNPDGTPDGTSVQINLHDHMTIGTDGNIHLSADHTDFVHAPAGTHVTPPYHPEAHAALHAEAPHAPVGSQPKMPDTHFSAHPGEPTSFAETPALYASVESQPTMPDTHFAPHSADHSVGQAPHAETAAPHAPLESTTPEIITNHFGLQIPTGVPHLYADGAKHILAYGGSSTERMNVIQEYLIAHPKDVVFSADANGANRVPWGLVDGKANVVGAPVRTSGFLGFFKSFMKAPGQEELQKIIQ